MIYIDSVEKEALTVDVDDIDEGTTFTGELQDCNGTVRIGIFLRIPLGVVYLNDVRVSFEDFGPVRNYREVDLKVVVVQPKK